VFPAGEPTGSFAVGTDRPVGESISGEDFALAVLDEFETPKNRKQRFTVAAS
jgi:putative NADH-flavin reductase